jgi:microcin C transport system ATP-binding protein
MGLLFITHNLSIVRQLADRVAVMQNGRCVEQNACRALFAAPNTLIPAPAGQRTLRQPGAAGRRCRRCCSRRSERRLPVRKGLLRRVVDHNRVVNSLSFQLRAGKRWAWWANRDREKHHRAGAAAPDCLEGTIAFDGQPLQGRNRRQMLPLRRDAGGLSGSQLVAESPPERAADY